jgi:hypothetical protein
MGRSLNFRQMPHFAALMRCQWKAPAGRASLAAVAGQHLVTEAAASANRAQWRACVTLQSHICCKSITDWPQCPPGGCGIRLRTPAWRRGYPPVLLIKNRVKAIVYMECDKRDFDSGLSLPCHTLLVGPWYERPIVVHNRMHNHPIPFTDSNIWRDRLTIQRHHIAAFIEGRPHDSRQKPLQALHGVLLLTKFRPRGGFGTRSYVVPSVSGGMLK